MRNKVIVSLIFVLTNIALIGCTEPTLLVEQIRNQNNCTLLRGDKVKIIDGLIVRKSDKALMGEIFKYSNSHIKVFDDMNESKILEVKKYSKEGKGLIAIHWDANNILLACGTD